LRIATWYSATSSSVHFSDAAVVNDAAFSFVVDIACEMRALAFSSKRAAAFQSPSTLASVCACTRKASTQPPHRLSRSPLRKRRLVPRSSPSCSGPVVGASFGATCRDTLSDEAYVDASSTKYVIHVES
jgi:hypothetical protein